MKLPPRKPVTPETCNLFRARALRKNRARFDEESGVVVPIEDMSKMQSWAHDVRQWFSKGYWTDKFENTGGEVLVDGPLLSWAYLEIGMIEAVGALTAFFVVMYRRGINPHEAVIMEKGNGAPTNYWSTNASNFTNSQGKVITAHEQVDILAEAQSMYYWAVMTMQMFNLFACKTRLSFPFGKYMFANRATFYCILAGVALGTFVVYVPGVEVVFKTTRSLSPLYWLIPIGFGVFILAYASVRMIVRRLTKPIRWNPEVSGLQMYPTIRTFRSVGSSRRERLE